MNSDNKSRKKRAAELEVFRQQAAEPEVDSTETRPISDKKPRLLLVDDDPVLMQFTTRLLQKLDAEIIEAGTGADALRLAQTEQPDLILLDVMLPDIDGLEVCRHIKANPNSVNSYVVLLSASKIASTEQAAGLAAGADGYIVRPVSEQEFLARLHALLRLRQTELALKQKEIRYRQLLDTIPSGVAVYQAIDDGQNFIFTDFNRAGETIEGVKREDILGHRVTEVFPGVRDFGLLAVFQEVWQTGTSQQFLVTLYRDERITGWRENYIYKLPSAEIVAVYNDVTERKLAEIALKESSEKYQNLFETMTQGVVYHRADGAIISANPAALRILGLTLDQLQGKTSLDPDWRAIHLDGSDFPGQTHPAMLALQTGQEVHNVIMGVYNPQQQEYTWLNVNATPQFKPGEERPYQVYATFEDITERIRAEQERKEQLAQELRALDVLSAPPQSAVTAQSFGVLPLRQNLPDIFAELVRQYADLMDKALEQQVYKIDHHLSDNLREVAHRLGRLRAGPRDVVDLHTKALRDKTINANPLKSKAYIEEGHLLALELMGYLTAYYRNHAVGSSREAVKGANDDK